MKIIGLVLLLMLPGLAHGQERLERVDFWETGDAGQRLLRYVQGLYPTACPGSPSWRNEVWRDGIDEFTVLMTIRYRNSRCCEARTVQIACRLAEGVVTHCSGLDPNRAFDYGTLNKQCQPTVPDFVDPPLQPYEGPPFVFRSSPDTRLLQPQRAESFVTS